MWLSKQRRGEEPDGHAAQLGVVTLEEARPGVYLSGERRGLTVVGPGGYCWRPAADQEVLVIKAGEEGERPCVAGVPCDGERGKELLPGDVGIYVGRAAVVLKTGGDLDLRGNVMLNGVLLSELFSPKEDDEEG